MAIPSSQERVDYGSPDGCVLYGVHRQVISGVENGTTPYQLEPWQSGALVVTASAAGAVYALPTPVTGMWFEFTLNVKITSNEFKVITKTIASEFLLGGIHISSTTAGGDDSFPANGTTHVSVSSSGTTTGGDIGGVLLLTAQSSTIWNVRGHLIGSGTIATPFDTS